MKRSGPATSNFDESDDSSNESNDTSRYENITPNSEITNENNRKQKQRIHSKIEKSRREMEQRHFKELSSLLPHWYDSKSSKVPQVIKLKLAADLLEQINANQPDLISPSYLNDNEKNFLDSQASHSFLFATTCELSAFRVIHVSDSIERTLHVTPEQWIGQDFCFLLHPEDSFVVRNQLLTLTQHIGQQISIQCRLLQGQNSYASVTIDGMIKKLDQSIIPIASTQNEYYAFVGICYLPLVDVYSQKNRDLQRKTQGNILTCRCTINDWTVFLVNGDLLPGDALRNRSVLDAISEEDRPQVKQALYDTSINLQEQTIFCNFLHPFGHVLTMVLKIKPIINRSVHKLEYLELNFEDYTDRVNNDLKMLE